MFCTGKNEWQISEIISTFLGGNITEFQCLILRSQLRIFKMSLKYIPRFKSFDRVVLGYCVNEELMDP